MFRRLAAVSTPALRSGVRAYNCNAQQAIAPIQIGAKANILDKDWAAMTAEGTIGKVNISNNVNAGKWTVLFTYPLDFTYVCPTEITAFSDAAPKFKAINTEVIGASIDSVFTHIAWRETPRKQGGLGKETQIPIIADLNRELGNALGCMMPGGHHSRCTVIIDDKGVVQHISQNNPPAGRSVDEVFRLVEAYQYVAKNGEVCPANFKKGDKTIKPSITGKLEYFEAVNK